MAAKKLSDILGRHQSPITASTVCCFYERELAEAGYEDLSFDGTRHLFDQSMDGNLEITYRHDGVPLFSRKDRCRNYPCTCLD